MVYDHIVKAFGKWYKAGEDVPTESPAQTVEPPKVETEKIEAETKVTKTRKKKV